MVIDAALNPVTPSANSWSQKIRFPSGDDRTLVIAVSEPLFDANGEPVLDDDEEQLTTPVDLAGAALIWELKKKVSDLTPLVQKTLSNGGIVLDDSDSSVCLVTIDAEDTETLAGKHYHELQVVDMFGQVSTPMRGPAIIEADVVL